MRYSSFSEYAVLSSTTLALPLSAGTMMIFSFLCRVLIESLSNLVLFNKDGLAFSSISLSSHLNLSGWARGMLKAISLLRAMMSKYDIRLMVEILVQYWLLWGTHLVLTDDWLLPSLGDGPCVSSSDMSTCLVFVLGGAWLHHIRVWIIYPGRAGSSFGFRPPRDIRLQFKFYPTILSRTNACPNISATR